MFKNNEITEKGIETIIGQSVKVKGNFTSKGSMQIDGQLEGTLKIGNDLIVGEGAKIVANAFAKRIMVSGEIKGNIKATESLEVTETAVIEGDIEAKIISIDPGAQVNGKIKMMTSSKEEKEQIIEEIEESPEESEPKHSSK